MPLDFTTARRPHVRPTGGSRPLTARGTSGAVIYGGYIADNERNAQLAGHNRYTTYADMLANVSIIAAGVRYYLNLLAKASWDLDPADESSEAQRLADQVSEIIDDMRRPWSRVIRTAGMYRFYGFSVQEWIAKRRDDGSFGLLDIANRPQNTIRQWDTAEDGNVLGAVQWHPISQVQIPLPRNKIVYVVDDALRDSPEGMGILRQLAAPSQTLLELQRLETYGYEMDLQGVPIIRAPLDAINRSVQAGEMTEAEGKAMTAGLDTFLQNHARRPDSGLMLDSAVYTAVGQDQTPSSNRQWDIETLQGGAADSAVAVSTAIERLNREMARIMGVEELMLGSDSAGSFAMSKQKSDNFALMVDSSLAEIRYAVQHDVVGSIFRINGWDMALMPQFRTEQIAFRDIEQITKSLKDLSMAGGMMAPDDPAINKVREILGLPKQDPRQLAQLVSLMADPDADDDDSKEGEEEDGNGPE